MTEQLELNSLSQQLGIDCEKIIRVIRNKELPEFGEEFLHMLEELSFVNEVLNDDTRYMLLNYATILAKTYTHKKEISKFLSSQATSIHWWGKKSEKSMDAAYLLFNALALVGVGLAVSGQLGAPVTNILDHPTINHCTTSAWNHHDESATFIAALRQWCEGETLSAVINVLNSIGSLTCTVLADLAIGITSPAVIHLSEIAVYGLLSYGFALNSLVPAFMEDYMAERSLQRIQKLEKKIEEIQTEIQDSQNISPEYLAKKQKNLVTLKKARDLEIVQYNAHISNRNALFVCALAMTAIAVIGFVALSGVTFGGLPAAMGLALVIAISAEVIRKRWVGARKDAEIAKVKNHDYRNANNTENAENLKTGPVERTKSRTLLSRVTGFFPTRKNSYEILENSDDDATKGTTLTAGISSDSLSEKEEEENNWVYSPLHHKLSTSD